MTITTMHATHTTIDTTQIMSLTDILTHNGITRKVKIETFSFDGRFDPKSFNDWLLMDEYFDQYDMSYERRVRFVKVKIEGSARIYWISITRDRERLDQDL